uniref:Bestrophin homolog n=1 Tax=Heterorhabditis bacteriophora TaxID=37862 RepID=A0A1I7XGT0_HETBA
MLVNYDWVPIPLAYPQVVFLAVRVYFIICLVSRQFILGSEAHNKSVTGLMIVSDCFNSSPQLKPDMFDDPQYKPVYKNYDHGTTGFIKGSTAAIRLSASSGDASVIDSVVGAENEKLYNVNIMAFQPTLVIFKPSQQRGRDVTVYLIPRKQDTCFEFSYFNKSKAGVIETYICTRCCGLKDKIRQVNYGVVPTVRVLNGAFIDDPENPRGVHYSQPKSAARALIPREVITECNSLRRGTSYETTDHIRRNIMASISKLDYDDFEPAEKRATMGILAVGYGASLDTLRRTIQRNRVNPIQPLVMGNIDASKYRCVTDEEDLLLKDDGNMIIAASRSLLKQISVILNLVNLFGDGWLKQISKEVKGMGSLQFYTVIMELNGGYCLPIFFAFIRDAKRTTCEDLFMLVLCNSFLDFIICFRTNQNLKKNGSFKGINGCWNILPEAKNATVYATTSCWAIKCIGAIEDSSC